MVRRHLTPDPEQDLLPSLTEPTVNRRVVAFHGRVPLRGI
jgi:hypothetical protein